MSFTAHPLWLVGFRPFFILACLAGLSLPALWLTLHFGLIDAPALARPPLQWHAHEMFFGFGWAVLGGFLLTASKNWVSIRGYHGSATCTCRGNSSQRSQILIVIGKRLHRTRYRNPRLSR